VIFLDALIRFSDAAAFLDSDSIVSDGFVKEVTEGLSAGAIMNRLEALDPAPHLAGFEAILPHSRYCYDRLASRMYNSGLIGARPEHAPVIEDAVALLDAFLGGPNPAPNVEQLAVGEAFRTHGIAIGQIHDTFLHYWPRSRRRYAEWRLPQILPRDWDDLRPPATKLTFNRLNVRLFSLGHSVRKRLPGAP
jgi:hypothetical protein